MQARGANASARATAHARDGKSKGWRSWAMARDGGGLTFVLASWSAGPRQFIVEKPLQRSHGIVEDCPYCFSNTIDGLAPINPAKQQHIRVEDAMKGGRNLLIVFVVVGRE